MTALTPNTFVVGAGPVATALAGALRLGGVPVLGLWARDPQRARAAAAAAGVAAFSAAPPDLLLDADVVLVAVRDDAIGEVAEMLVGTGLVASKHTLVHCSGSMAAGEAFAAVRGQLGGIATVHPLRAIADGRAVMRELRGTAFGIEGDERGRAQAAALVRALGGTALPLDGAHMAVYHAAAAMASNYLVALLDGAAAALMTSGASREAALAALLPLARGALDNVARRGVDDGLTGPIRRGDRATVERHLQALGDPELSAMYRVLGRRTLAIARRIGEADGADLDAIDALLDDAPPADARRAGGA